MLPMPRQDVERLHQILALQPRLLGAQTLPPRPPRAVPRRPALVSRAMVRVQKSPI
jgi:hypothetical protein